jgi:hypothetical protein
MNDGYVSVSPPTGIGFTIESYVIISGGVVSVIGSDAVDPTRVAVTVTVYAVLYARADVVTVLTPTKVPLATCVAPFNTVYS